MRVATWRALSRALLLTFSLGVVLSLAACGSPEGVAEAQEIVTAAENGRPIESFGSYDLSGCKGISYKHGAFSNNSPDFAGFPFAYKEPCILSGGNVEQIIVINLRVENGAWQFVNAYTLEPGEYGVYP